MLVFLLSGTAECVKRTSSAHRIEVFHSVPLHAVWAWRHMIEIRVANQNPGCVSMQRTVGTGDLTITPRLPSFFTMLMVSSEFPYGT